MRPIIKVGNLSKSYRIGELEAGYATLREAVARKVAASLRRRMRRGEAGETLWP